MKTKNITEGKIKSLEKYQVKDMESVNGGTTIVTWAYGGRCDLADAATGMDYACNVEDNFRVGQTIWDGR